MISSRGELNELSEAELLDAVVVPLLRKMGYQDVFEWHGGSGELGKDVVCWKAGDFDQRINFAFVLKAKSISGGAAPNKGSGGEAAIQVQQCLGASFQDPTTGEEQVVHRCVLVTSGRIQKEAIAAISASLKGAAQAHNVEYINGDKLWSLIEKHFPMQPVWKTLQDLQKELDKADPHYRPTIQMGGSGPSISLEEKFPGAAQQKPLKLKGAFTFPDTPEGQATLHALERHIATGSPVSIPSQYVESFEFPELLRELIGVSTGSAPELQLSNATNQRELQVRLECSAHEGPSIALPHIHLKVIQAGTEEATLGNDAQGIAIRMRMVLQAAAKTANITFNLTPGPHNVKQIYEWEVLCSIMKMKGEIRLLSLETGLPLFVSNIEPNSVDGYVPLNATILEELGDLVAIQERTNTPITIPEREFTDEEIRTMGLLRAILQQRELVSRWSSVDLSLIPAGVRIMLDAAEKAGPKYLAIEEEATENLFGSELHLGRLRMVYHDVMIADEPKVRRTLAGIKDDKTPIEITLIPGVNNKLVWEYVEWLSSTEST